MDEKERLDYIEEAISENLMESFQNQIREGEPDVFSLHAFGNEEVSFEFERWKHEMFGETDEEKATSFTKIFTRAFDRFSKRLKAEQEGK